MINNIDSAIRDCLLNKEIDDNWCRKVENSVKSINLVFHTRVKKEDIRFVQLSPELLWVNCEEELDIQYADSIEKKLSVKQLAPITVVEFKEKKIIYMGSVRAILYCRYQGTVDCIVVRLRTKNAEEFYKLAKKRLCEFDIF